MALNLLFQNRDKYATLLDTHIKQADASPNAAKQLHLYSQPERTRIAATIWSHSTNQHDLVYPFESEQPQEREEVVLNIQGYVLRANLPPITSGVQLTKNPSTAKQSLVLSGLGSDLFDKCAKAIIEIHSRFATHLPSNALELWKPLIDEEVICLEFANRYLTPDRLATIYDTVPFDESIDPFGMLRGKAGGKRTEDNVVLYYERVPLEDDKYRYEACNPIMIKVGHLVEAQVSFSVVPISKGRYLLLCKLRSICIIDQQVHKDLNDITFEALKTATRADTRKLKRKVGYEKESPSAKDTTQAMKKMRIGEGTNDNAQDGAMATD